MESQAHPDPYPESGRGPGPGPGRGHEPAPLDALRGSYAAFGSVVAALDEEASWAPTGCTGWAVRDLVFHCVLDAQRALVALHTPAAHGTEPDRDAVGYWTDWRPGTEGAANGRRFSRVNGSMFLRFGQLRELYLETAAAAVVAAERADPRDRIMTQGHVLTCGDLMATLAVEASVHHLDLTAHLPDAAPPSPAGLACVRATLDGLLGRRPPRELGWDDAHYARVATGRLPLTAAETRLLGPAAARFPLFG